jgi:hypothetical protein
VPHCHPSPHYLRHLCRRPPLGCLYSSSNMHMLRCSRRPTWVAQ